MRRLNVIFCVVFCFACANACARTWTGKNGRQIDAELVGGSGDRVILRPVDGGESFFTSIRNLVEEDQQRIWVLSPGQLINGELGGWVDADFVMRDGQSVILRKTGGTQVAVPYAALDARCRSIVDRLAGPKPQPQSGALPAKTIRAAAPPSPTPPPSTVRKETSGNAAPGRDRLGEAIASGVLFLLVALVMSAVRRLRRTRHKGSMVVAAQKPAQATRRQEPTARRGGAGKVFAVIGWTFLCLVVMAVFYDVGGAAVVGGVGTVVWILGLSKICKTKRVVEEKEPMQSAKREEPTAKPAASYERIAWCAAFVAGGIAFAIAGLLAHSFIAGVVSAIFIGFMTLVVAGMQGRPSKEEHGHPIRAVVGILITVAVLLVILGSCTSPMDR